MPNKLEQLAEKKRQEAAEAREREIRELASVIADETLSRIKGLSDSNRENLEASVSELALAIANAVAQSNARLSETVDASLTKLVDKVRTTVPIEVDNSANEALFTRVADALVSFDRTVGSLKLDPVINFSAATEADIKKHIDRLIAALPDVAKSSVKIEYEKVAPTSYINVRLTDGLNFYKALGGGGGAGAGFDKEGLASESKQDEIIQAIEESSQAPTPSTIRNGKKTVASSGTAVVIVASSTPVSAVVVQALADNTGLVYVGDASVDSSTGMELQAGQATGIAIDDLNKIYIDADEDGDGVCFIGS